MIYQKRVILMGVMSLVFSSTMHAGTMNTTNPSDTPTTVPSTSTTPVASTTPAVATTSTNEPKPYTVIDGKVDAKTFNGYRRYHSICHTCHGPDAVGGSFAPSLVDSFKRLSKADAMKTITNGRINPSTNMAMPSFKENKDIMDNLEDIYSYVKARSDGAIDRGRPVKIPDAPANQ